jgi:DNA mismatch repair protein MutL
MRVPLLRLVGQIGRTYLVAEGPDGLYLIDQHAAHERVLFERFRSLHAQNQSQYLLEPVCGNPRRLDKDLENQVETLNHLGFKAENFGPSTYRITAIPWSSAISNRLRRFSARSKRMRRMNHWWKAPWKIN